MSKSVSRSHSKLWSTVTKGKRNRRKPHSYHDNIRCYLMLHQPGDEVTRRQMKPEPLTCSPDRSSAPLRLCGIHPPWAAAARTKSVIVVGALWLVSPWWRDGDGGGGVGVIWFYKLLKFDHCEIISSHDWILGVSDEAQNWDPNIKSTSWSVGQEKQQKRNSEALSERFSPFSIRSKDKDFLKIISVSQIFMEYDGKAREERSHSGI